MSRHRNWEYIATLIAVVVTALLLSIAAWLWLPEMPR